MEKHTTIIGKIVIILAISVIFMSTTAVGDIAPPHAQGETMQPVNVTNVQMVNETVHIDLCIENAAVKCNFTMMNHGENETLLVGFPVGLGWEGHGEEPYTYPLEDFKAYVNSQSVETKMMDVNGRQLLGAAQFLWELWQGDGLLVHLCTENRCSMGRRDRRGKHHDRSSRHRDGLDN